MPTVCVDTNIWIYALSIPNTGDANKHQLAQSCIQNAGKITLTPQIINELGFALRRKHAWTDDGLRIINPFK
jgi:predicted nucleic acid-binding protein